VSGMPEETKLPEEGPKGSGTPEAAPSEEKPKGKRASAKAGDEKSKAKGAAEEAGTEDKRRATDYVVTLPSFEGPLDLLLHLIQKHELDIFDIPVSFVTEKYLEYINLMQVLSIDVASEYLVMAATLAYIKSKSLLPNEPSTDEETLGEDEETDPREELIRRLLEYQKYKQAAAELNDRGALGRDIFLRGSKAPEAEGPAPLAQVELWSLLDAFGKVLSRAKVDIQHEVSFDRTSITDRIAQLLEKMKGRARFRFEDLFEEQRTRFELIVTFLALLEMTRLKLTRLYQSDPLSEIFIETILVGAETPPNEAPEPAV
jgi:segregation and condensation protein A